MELLIVRVNPYGAFKPELDVFEAFGMPCVKPSYLFASSCNLFILPDSVHVVRRSSHIPRLGCKEVTTGLQKKKNEKNFLATKKIVNWTFKVYIILGEAVLLSALFQADQ